MFKDKGNYLQMWSENEMKKRKSEYWKTILKCSNNEALCDFQDFSHKTSDKGKQLVRLIG